MLQQSLVPLLQRGEFPAPLSFLLSSSRPCPNFHCRPPSPPPSPSSQGRNFLKLCRRRRRRRKRCLCILGPPLHSYMNSQVGSPKGAATWIPPPKKGVVPIYAIPKWSDVRPLSKIQEQGRTSILERRVGKKNILNSSFSLNGEQGGRHNSLPPLL